MALKPDRNVLQDNISYFCYSVSERGGVMVSTSGTVNGGASGTPTLWPGGASLDNASRRCYYADEPSGRRPVGMAMWDAVNLDLSRVQPNRYKSEFQVGGKMLLMTQGTAVTNMIGPAQGTGNIQYPCLAILGPSGMLWTATSQFAASAATGLVYTGLSASGWPVVGKFLTPIDADGYAEVQIQL